MVLDNLPLFHYDEDIRSIIYRYHVRSPNEAFSQTQMELFGLKTYKSSVIPQNLSVLKERFTTDDWTTLEYLLEHHTLFPLWNSFMTSYDKANDLNDILLFEYDNKSKQLTTPRNFISYQVKYCPECMLLDYNTVGECYIHRIHQIKFIDICPLHYCRLITHCQNCYEPLTKEFCEKISLIPYCPNGHDVTQHSTIPAYLSQKEQEVIGEVEWILKNHGLLNVDTIETCFLAYMHENRYMYLSGKFLKQKLISDMVSFFGKDLFERITGYTIIQFTTKSNLSNILSSYQTQYIRYMFFYILLMIFFAGSIREFIDSNKVYKTDMPFGLGPWKCRNINCKSEIHKIIRKLWRGGRGFLGDFRCTECGFSFTLSIDLNTKNETYKVTSIGTLKDDIISLHNIGMSMSEIAYKLEMSKSTVKKSFLNKNKKTNRVATENSHKLTEYKEKIIKIIAENKDFSRSQIIKLANTEYYWLKRHNENKWLESVLPKSKRGSSPLDFVAIDLELSQKIYKSFEILKDKDIKGRIRKSTILNSLDKIERGRVEHYSDKLPLSSEALTNCEETYDDYNLRRLPRIFQYFKERGYQQVKFDMIMNRNKNRSSYKYTTERGKEIIIDKLDELNNRWNK